MSEVDPPPNDEDPSWRILKNYLDERDLKNRHAIKVEPQDIAFSGTSYRLEKNMLPISVVRRFFI